MADVGRQLGLVYDLDNDLLAPQGQINPDVEEPAQPKNYSNTEKKPAQRCQVRLMGGTAEP